MTLNYKVTLASALASVCDLFRETTVRLEQSAMNIRRSSQTVLPFQVRRKVCTSSVLYYLYLNLCTTGH